jgi:hypothetical protein
VKKYDPNLLRLVDTLCTADQVKELLRLAKERSPKDVRITAENKTDLIERNLRAAIESGGIPPDRVYDAIRDAEENGDQHIFYFTPKSKTVRDSMALESLGDKMWGKHWQEKKKFPTATTPEDGFDYADFRSFDQKPNHWILKVYGQMKYERYTGHDEEEDDKVYKEFVKESLRVVSLARWNPPNLLELRVQRDESRRRISAWLDTLWTMLAPAIKRTDFDPWDLQKARKRLIEEEDEHEGVYSFRDTRLLDPHSIRASFEPHQTDGYLFASIEAKEAIQGLLDAHSECTHLSVTWLPRKDGTPSLELRTLLGDRGPHEVVIPSHCKARDVDYVTDQLRFFNR